MYTLHTPPTINTWTLPLRLSIASCAVACFTLVLNAVAMALRLIKKTKEPKWPRKILVGIIITNLTLSGCSVAYFGITICHKNGKTQDEVFCLKISVLGSFVIPDGKDIFPPVSHAVMTLFLWSKIPTLTMALRSIPNGLLHKWKKLTPVKWSLPVMATVIAAISVVATATLTALRIDSILIGYVSQFLLSAIIFAFKLMFFHENREKKVYYSPFVKLSYVRGIQVASLVNLSPLILTFLANAAGIICLWSITDESKQQFAKELVTFLVIWLALADIVVTAYLTIWKAFPKVRKVRVATIA
ncbi:hypothetical protein L596_000725 [Steinernema carpocapsae]|uniref:Uncharacterized protein n=1 Tax=Steinernema carpocapsae TaxID=34508 RepID=A0A4U8ULE4_STECR|nr:hypothetical protein L596_000725 [Steinernema carpocapsae]